MQIIRKIRNKKNIIEEFSSWGPVYKGLSVAMTLAAIAFLVMLIAVDALPASITLTFIGFMLLLLAGAGLLFGRKRKGLRIIGIFLAVFFVVIYGTGAYYMSTTYIMLERISVESQEAQALAKKVNVAEEPFNVYITGIDQWAKEKGLDLERSDVNMIITVSPKTRKILLTSIPRDAYVPLHTTKRMDKLTHTGVYGVDETLKTVEDWLGFDMNYYIKANFTAVVNIVNAIGCIDVYSPMEFNPVKRPQWTVKKGWNRMNGRQAVAFAREREAFEGKDSIRVENQQRVIEAILKKLMSSSTLLIKYGDIMEAAGESLETNMPTSDMKALIKMQLADLVPWEIETQKIDGEYDMDYVASLTQARQFQVFRTDPASVEKAKKAIDKVMNPTSAEVAQAMAQRQKNSMFSFFRNIFSGKKSKKK
ncbi:MAG TPA: LCP family protein [Mogibacterium sp.]|nr:LCP family protein [Mogibacterium sp.]